MTAQILPANFENFIFASNDDLRTNSLNIAKAFEKQHKDVLRVIDRIISQVSDSFGQRNFTPSSYINEQSKEQRMFELTKDGFMILVMSFTGIPAMQIKEAYINAFNLMHAKLFPKRNALVELPVSPYLSHDDRTTLKEAVNAHCFANKKDNQQAMYWKLFHRFRADKVELLPAGKLDEMLIYLGLKMPTPHDMVSVRSGYLADLEQKAKALPAPAQKFEPIAAGCVVIPIKDYDKSKRIEDMISTIVYQLRYNNLV